jgi:hypothetical protein
LQNKGFESEHALSWVPSEQLGTKLKKPAQEVFPAVTLITFKPPVGEEA